MSRLMVVHMSDGAESSPLERLMRLSSIKSDLSVLKVKLESNCLHGFTFFTLAHASSAAYQRCKQWIALLTWIVSFRFVVTSYRLLTVRLSQAPAFNFKCATIQIRKFITKRQNSAGLPNHNQCPLEAGGQISWFYLIISHNKGIFRRLKALLVFRPWWRNYRRRMAGYLLTVSSPNYEYLLQIASVQMDNETTH